MLRILLFGFVLGTSVCYGQQVPQYSQYIQNQYMVNPAATGVYDYTGVSLGGRWQWAGFEGAPRTSYLYFVTPLNRNRSGRMKRTFGVIKRNKRAVRHPKMHFGKTSHAFGGHVLADQYGPFRQFKLMGTYAVHLPLSREYNLSFGTSVGFGNRSFNADNAQVLSVLTNNGVYDATYANYTSGQGSQFNLELAGGLYFYGKQAFVGVSGGQLTKDFVKFGNANLNFDPRMHFHFTGGYKFHPNTRWSITPAFLIKYVRSAPVSWELSSQFDYQERLWFGATYRHGDAVVFMIGTNVSNQFKVGYSFDFSTTQLRNYSIGGHELVLTLMLGRGDIR